MGTDLIPVDVFGSISTQLASDEDFADLSNASKFLRRIALKSKGALIDTGKVKPGHYAIIKGAEDADDLGDSIDILPLDRRPKAIDFSDPDQIVTTFDRNSNLFRDIEKRSAQPNSKCQYGVSFLVVERTTGQLYELFLGSPSDRREAATVADFLPVTAEEIDRHVAAGKKPRSETPRGPLPVTLKSKHVENKKQSWSWFVIVPRPCSNPFTADQMPDLETIKAEVEKFRTPDDGNKPEVETADTGRKRAR